MYRFLGNNTTKRSSVQGPKRYTNSIGTDEATQMEYIKLSYPSTKEGVWNTEEAVSDLKKYGA
jgi:hypothetical protein